ncbi:hypothetical protein PQX77_015341 [Marasmius sp. AFHP31]|nr:hypothetical protein PQX77_015341 [Marasmius sp. AFHP31]
MNSIGLIGAAMMGKGMPFIPENAFIFATGTNICNAYSIANTGFNSLITIITGVFFFSPPYSPDNTHSPHASNENLVN